MFLSSTILKAQGAVRELGAGNQAGLMGLEGCRGTQELAEQNPQQRGAACEQLAHWRRARLSQPTWRVLRECEGGRSSGRGLLARPPSLLWGGGRSSSAAAAAGRH